MGKLIILEGGDGSGKATQTALLKERLIKEGYRVQSVSFPNYDSPAAMPIKLYLRGDFGKTAEAVNPYVASTFYAIDRFASFRQTWQAFYEEEDTIVLADRYTTSNMVHQMVKYDSPAERTAFLDWLEDFEFTKFALPKPDMVILLDVPLAVSEALMAERTAKTGGATGDIHENDSAYLRRCHEAYRELVERYGWHRISCTAEGEATLLSRESIHEAVYACVKTCIGKVK